MLDRFEQWLHRRVYYEGDSDEILMVKKIWWICLCFAIPVLFMLSACMQSLSQKEIALFTFLSSFFWVFSLLLFNFLKRGIEWFGLSSQLFLILFSFVMAWLMGGLLTSGGIMFLGLVGPVYALIFPKRRRAILVMLIYLLAVIILLLNDDSIEAVYELSYRENLYLFVLTFIIGAVFWFIALYFFASQRTKALQELSIAEEKSNRLLLNILPAEIAENLKESNQVIANKLQEVSVLFADLVNFSETVSHMPAEDVIDLLNTIFSVFDRFTEKYGLEKIKTIGDCYMAAAGAPTADPNHAVGTANMALDIMNYAAENNLSFRIGINSGPVVAGVIGTKKFSYDLWGDVVNIASRLESEAPNGDILISDHTYQLISHLFRCEYYGDPELKGVGRVKAWKVISDKT